MSIWTSWLASPPLEAAVEVSPAAVSMAVVGGRRLAVQGYAVEPLPAGAVVPSLTAANVVDAGAVTDALRAACDSVGVKPSRTALVIPDLAARVSLVHFEKVPPRREDLEQLMRWQVRKSTPFSLEEACFTYTAGAQGESGTEFVAVAARREVVRGYEEVCERVGMEAGLVDTATFAVVNLCLSAGPTDGDWLVVHLRPEYASVVILRGEHVIFFRNRSEDDPEALEDVVHQAAMYYQDRLRGRGFTRVFLGGSGQGPETLDEIRRRLEERLGAIVELIDPTQTVDVARRIPTTPELMATLAPLVGMLVRSRQEAVAV